MPNTTKKAIAAAVTEKTGVKPAEAKRALETVLGALKVALASGRDVDLGKELGKLKVATRKPARRINRNLKNRAPTIETVHERHPKTVRLRGGKDMTENPQPVVVHPKQPEQRTIPARSAHFRVAVPQFRGRAEQTKENTMKRISTETKIIKPHQWEVSWKVK